MHDPIHKERLDLSGGFIIYQKRVDQNLTLRRSLAERLENCRQRREADGTGNQMLRGESPAVEGFDGLGELMHVEENRHVDIDLLRDRAEGIHVIRRCAKTQHDDFASGSDKRNAKIDKSGLADAFEDDVRTTRTSLADPPSQRFIGGEKCRRAEIHRALLLKAMEIGHDNLAGAKTPRPEGDGETNRAGADDQHPIARLHACAPHAVQANRKRLGERAIRHADSPRQFAALPAGDRCIFRIASADELHALAPGGLSRQATRAFAASVQWRHAHLVAGFQTVGFESGFDHFARNLVAENVSGRYAEDGLGGHVKIAAANAAAAYLEEDLVALRSWTLDLGYAEGLS